MTDWSFINGTDASYMYVRPFWNYNTTYTIYTNAPSPS